MIAIMVLTLVAAVDGQTYIHSVYGYGNSQTCSGGSPSDAWFIDGDCLTTFTGSANVSYTFHHFRPLFSLMCFVLQYSIAGNALRICTFTDSVCRQLTPPFTAQCTTYVNGQCNTGYTYTWPAQPTSFATVSTQTSHYKGFNNCLDVCFLWAATGVC